MNEIVEGKLKRSTWFQKLHYNNDDGSITALGKLGIYISRAVLIMGLAILASFIPGFGVFSSLVGSTVCALISFVLPASFHLKLLGPTLNFWQKSLDILIVFFGLLFAAYSTYNTIVGVSVWRKLRVQKKANLQGIGEVDRNRWEDGCVQKSWNWTLKVDMQRLPKLFLRS